MIDGTTKNWKNYLFFIYFKIYLLNFVILYFEFLEVGKCNVQHKIIEEYQSIK